MILQQPVDSDHGPTEYLKPKPNNTATLYKGYNPDNVDWRHRKEVFPKKPRRAHFGLVDVSEIKDLIRGSSIRTSSPPFGRCSHRICRRRKTYRDLARRRKSFAGQQIIDGDKVRISDSGVRSCSIIYWLFSPHSD